MKQGIVPSEYKPYTIKSTKKYNANEAFILNPDLKQQYENRCYQPREPEEVVREEPPEDEIRVQRETKEVKITYAPQQMNGEEEERQEVDRGFESIMGMIKEAKREFRIQGEYEVQWKAD